MALHIVISNGFMNRTHQTDNHSHKCHCKLCNMTTCQKEEPQVVSKKEYNNSSLLKLMEGGEYFGSLVDVEKVLE